MQQIINFVIRNKTFLLFLVLFSLSLILTIQSHSYHRSKFINSANSITGGIYGSINSFSQYFRLRDDNHRLLDENRLLRDKLYNRSTRGDSVVVDSFNTDGTYKFITASVYKNSYSATNNYLTINKGESDGIQEDFGVLTSKGIVGIIDNTSDSYARVMSILNSKSRINAQLKNSNHIGSLIWDGKSPHKVQLVDVSKFAPVNVGDTIITGGQSSIFPKGILIGEIASYESDVSGDTYNIEIDLFNDMTDLGYVYIVKNRDKEEIELLDKTTNE
ncbi:MAG: rod shape-determining protein MreC [Winogradskyella sp.]|nr:rod shape-determining protein MreC [Winogradskyella sp.]NNC45444.1 rod shape-determining protein MreC [Winogradskyella sp.]NNF85513.1 rod shape-determining protein MreC [Winogradskyella sp.]NNK40560.1 rod shape-determining protein MreC [Winogradskyella sp.]NNL82044.1 rod shape-determining protein MreC [Winogradskyella sp.]